MNLETDPFGAVLLAELLKPGRQLWTGKLVQGYGSDAPKPTLAVTENQGNLIGSLSEDGSHYPVIDIDMPAYLVPSSTEGHHHLYIQRAVRPDKYFTMLEALADAGIVEDGYARHSKKKGQSFALKPGLRKQLPRYEAF